MHLNTLFTTTTSSTTTESSQPIPSSQTHLNPIPDQVVTLGNQEKSPFEMLSERIASVNKRLAKAMDNKDEPAIGNISANKVRLMMIKKMAKLPAELNAQIFSRIPMPLLEAIFETDAAPLFLGLEDTKKNIVNDLEKIQTSLKKEWIHPAFVFRLKNDIGKLIDNNYLKEENFYDNLSEQRSLAFFLAAAERSRPDLFRHKVNLYPFFTNILQILSGNNVLQALRNLDDDFPSIQLWRNYNTHAYFLVNCLLIGYYEAALNNDPDATTIKDSFVDKYDTLCRETGWCSLLPAQQYLLDHQYDLNSPIISELSLVRGIVLKIDNCVLYGLNGMHKEFQATFKMNSIIELVRISINSPGYREIIADVIKQAYEANIIRFSDTSDLNFLLRLTLYITDKSLTQRIYDCIRNDNVSLPYILPRDDFTNIPSSPDLLLSMAQDGFFEERLALVNNEVDKYYQTKKIVTIVFRRNEYLLAERILTLMPENNQLFRQEKDQWFQRIYQAIQNQTKEATPPSIV